MKNEIIDTEFARWTNYQIHYMLAKGRRKGRGGWHDPEQCTTKSLATLAQAHVNRGKDQYIDAAILYLMAAWREEQSEKNSCHLQ